MFTFLNLFNLVTDTDPKFFSFKPIILLLLRLVFCSGLNLPFSFTGNSKLEEIRRRSADGLRVVPAVGDADSAKEAEDEEGGGGTPLH